MQKVAVDLSPKQAEELADQLIARLTPAAQLRLTAKLERTMRQARWKPLVLKMRRRFAQRPLSPTQLRRLCEQVRREHYEERGRAARRR